MRDFVLAALMVVSAAALVFRWLSLYNREDALTVFFAILLVASLALFLISIELRMQRMQEEYQSLKRTIGVISEDIEGRVEKIVYANMKAVENKLESIEKRIYR